jgi:uncharacterized membrane protein
MHDSPTTSDQPGSSRSPLSGFNEPSSTHTRYNGPLKKRRANGANGSRQLAKALGWFSIGIGVAEILAPRAIARASGMTERPLLLRALGVREIASGVGILSQRQPTGWLWSRVVGDAMDLALLGVAARSSSGARRNRVAIAAAAVAGVALLDVVSSMQQSSTQNAAGSADSNLEKCITINRSADECYRFWRDFENLPRFMKHLESVQHTTGNRSHWKAIGPAGSSVEWDAEITADRPGELLSWRSIEGADADNAGTVRFEPAAGGRGAIVRVEMQYSPPGGKAGALVAKLFGENPDRQIDEDLRHFKQLIETGQIATTAGQSSGPRSAMMRLIKKGAPG